MRWLNRIARAMLGMSGAAYVGIHSVARSHPAPGWNLGIFAAGALAIAFVCLTEPALRDRRQTYHVGAAGEGGLRLWREPPVKPLFLKRRLARERAKGELEVGRRAIEVGDRVLAAYWPARAKINATLQSNRPLPDLDHEHFAASQDALEEVKGQVGAAWSEVLADLRNIGALKDGDDAREISVNITGLDTQANLVKSIGHGLLRKHDIDRDAKAGVSPGIPADRAAFPLGPGLPARATPSYARWELVPEALRSVADALDTLVLQMECGGRSMNDYYERPYTMALDVIDKMTEWLGYEVVGRERERDRVRAVESAEDVKALAEHLRDRAVWFTDEMQGGAGV